MEQRESNMGDSAKLVPIIGGIAGAALGQAYLGPMLGAAMGSVGALTPAAAAAGVTTPVSAIMGLSPSAIGGALGGLGGTAVGNKLSPQVDATQPTANAAMPAGMLREMGSPLARTPAPAGGIVRTAPQTTIGTTTLLKDPFAEMLRRRLLGG